MVIRMLRVALALSLLLAPGIAQAQTTTPPHLIYEGRLLDASGKPITSPLTLRFSLWKGGDWVSTDTNADGSIHTGSSTYGGWQEAQSLTPNSNGIISANLGTSTPLPQISYDLHRFIQVEVKGASKPDTSYALLDPTGDKGSDTSDRTLIGSVAYAKNAETVGNLSPGSGPGNIVILQADGKIPLGAMAGGVEAESFTINADRSGGDVTLTFGNSLLEEVLRFSSSKSQFEFSDDVLVEGALTASGGLTVKGPTTLPSTVKLGGVTYTFPPNDGASAGKTLKTDGTGNLSWGDDIDTTLAVSDLDKRYVNTSGDTMTGALRIGNAEGVTTEGTIATEGGVLLNAAHTAKDAVLTFGNLLLAETLRFSHGNHQFEFSDDVAIQGALAVQGSVGIQGALSAQDTATFEKDLTVKKSLSGENLTVTNLKNCRSVETGSGGALACAPKPSSSPPAPCTAATSGKQWQDTDTGITYTCDAGNGRNKWLSFEDLLLEGSRTGSCGLNQDATSDEDCSASAGWGFYLPHPITITGYSYAAEGDDCETGDFDVEVWSTGSNTNNTHYTLEKSLARNLNGAIDNAANLNIDIGGNQHILFGLDNNCGEKIDDWSVELLYRWRHD